MYCAVGPGRVGGSISCAGRDAMSDEHHGTVLIVEDDDELQFILTTHLSAMGFACVSSRDGASAIQEAINSPPDLIIMDIGLPVVDGIAATRALKADARTADIPVIMLTARSGRDNVIRGLEAGAQEYLVKPFDVAELLARVRTVRRLSQARERLDRLNTQLEAEVDVKTRRLQVLYEFMRDLNLAEARDRILDLFITCVRDLIGAERISLFLTDETGENLVCERAIGMDAAQIPPVAVSDVEGITGQVFRSGKTLAAKTYSTAAASRRANDYVGDVFLSTPLIRTSSGTRHGVIGVLNLTERPDDDPFSDEEIDCVRTISDAATIALDNVTRRMRLQQSVRVLLQTVGLLAEYRDEETKEHLTRVTKTARILANELRNEGTYVSLVTNDFIETLVQAAPMHDIGKVGISDEILTKPGKLTDEEFQIMKTHTEIGRRVLSIAFDPICPVPLLEMCIDIAHCHHERYDGRGYPRRLVAHDIPLSARIIALVDAYDAITSLRRYKPAKLHHEAVDIIHGESGRHFDPAIVEAFLRCHERFNELHDQHAETADKEEEAALPS